VNNDIEEISSSSLFPSIEVQKLMEQYLDAALRDVQTDMRNERVESEFDAKKFANELSRFDFSRQIGLKELLPWVIDRMREGNVQITHPRYFGLPNPVPAFPSLLAERIVAAFNLQLCSTKASTAAAALEAHMITQIAYRIGFGQSSAGYFTNGGGEANFTALICALTSACPAFRDHGAAALQVPPAIYVSKDAHNAWLTIAHQAGIGRLAVRIINTDGHGRLSAAGLRRAVETDIDNGVMPVMVVGTAGTMVAGMIDPLRECAGIAERAAAWFHVDATCAGAAIASDNARTALAGIEMADSVTIDAQNWFATTMSCGMFISRKSCILDNAFGPGAPFTPSGTSIEPSYANSVLWSRRFLGLRLFMNLATVGWRGYAQHANQTATTLNVLRRNLESAGWTAVNRGALGVLCVVPPEGFRSVPTIVDEIAYSGRSWVSAAVYEGVEVVRICITNGNTEMQDIEALTRLLNFCGQPMGAHQ
jgi:glutamate/tyrosine decarboxylase-like PLP-dependent enzyme